MSKIDEIYLDAQNSAEPASYAIDAMQSAINSFGSLHAPHAKGEKARAALREHCSSITDLTSPSLNHDLFFYNSYAEMLFRLFTRYRMQEARWEGKNHIFFWDREPQILSDCLCEGLPQKEGVIDMESFARLITPKTGMVVMPHADPLTGLIQPVEEMAELCKTHQILLHVDGSHSLGKIPFQVSDYPEISFGFSTNALHTPVDSGLLLFPKDRGCDHLESEISIPLLASANMACRHAYLYMDKISLEIPHLRMQFEEKLQSVGETPLSSAFRLPNVSLMLFPFVHQEMLAYRLSKRKVYAAISYGQRAIEESLRSFSLLEEERFTAISFAFSRFTTSSIIQEAAVRIIEEVKILQKKSRKVFHVGSLQ